MKFRIDEKIGKGGFGLVYSGTELRTGRQVALKLMSSREDTRMIKDEAGIYAALAGGVGIPEVFWFGEEQDFYVLAHELLGPTLEDLFNYCGRRFSLKTLLLLADQAIARLAYIHRKGFLHRDIKPDNFLMGVGIKGNVLYTIDFGLSRERYDRDRFSTLEGRSFGGTARYASINNHNGREQSWCDDLESLGYVLIYFANGSLPWQGFKADKDKQKNEKIREKKTAMSAAELCEGLPSEFARYMDYVRSLQYDDKPDYARLRRLFARLFKERGFKHDNVYDWTEKLFYELGGSKAQEDG
ncbi:hypothetical protein MY11210_001332 [Beauveria gryllotalpidicola]